MSSLEIIFLICFIVTLVIGPIIGYLVALKVFKKQLKKNPPISEAQIRMMYSQMGRKPTETQIKQIMRTFKNQTA